MQSRNYTIPLVTLIFFFFMWGFITYLNEILINFLKFDYILAQFCFFGAYFIGPLIYLFISILKGDPINKVGYKRGILLGIFLAAFGCILLYPAVAFFHYPLFMGAVFILGLGFTVLQITANTYVSLLGTEGSASSRLNMAHAFNSLGTVFASILGGQLIFKFLLAPSGSLSAMTTGVPYLILAGILLLAALLISIVKLPSFHMAEKEAVKDRGILRFYHLYFGILAMYCYAGGETAVGSFMISFLEESHIMGFDKTTSYHYQSLYLGGLIIGRFLGVISLNQSLSQGKKAVYMLGAATLISLVMFSISDLTFAQVSFFLVFILLNFIAFFIGKANPARTLSIFAAMNVILLISTIVNHGEIAIYSVLGIGIFNSIMFSNIYTLAISGLGKYTNQGASLVVMATLGGPIIPIFQGFLAKSSGVQNSFVIPVFCYFIILIFGVYCTKYLGHVESTKAKS